MKTILYWPACVAMSSGNLITRKTETVENKNSTDDVALGSRYEEYKHPRQILEKEVTFANGLTLLFNASSKSTVKFNPNNTDKNPMKEVSDHTFLDLHVPDQVTISGKRFSPARENGDNMNEVINNDGSISITIQKCNIAGSVVSGGISIYDDPNGRVKASFIDSKPISYWKNVQAKRTEDGDYEIFYLSGGVFHRDKKYIDTIHPFVSKDELSYENGLS